MGHRDRKVRSKRHEGSDPTLREGYSSSHGDARRLLHQDQSQSAAGPEDARPSGFPSVEDLKALNQRIHDDAGSPELFKLDQPSALESCLTRARAAYSHSPDGVIGCAAIMAHGIARAQAFMDGNRRTAFTATRYFLVANGYGHLTSETASDHILARYLNQVVESPSGSPPGPDKFEKLFR